MNQPACHVARRAKLLTGLRRLTPGAAASVRLWERGVPKAEGVWGD
jgi:hypothetical protein